MWCLEEENEHQHEKEPNHQDPMNRKQFVIRIRSDQIARRGDQFHSHQGGRHRGNHEIKEDREEYKEVNKIYKCT